MTSPLELRHLRTLLALRDTGNLSRAAQLMNLTQSALSHQIKVLEAHYGALLFARKSQPVLFAPAGRALLDLADAVVPVVGAAEREVQRLARGVGGSLRIAVECHTCFDWLMPAMDAFRARWPEIDLDIVSGFQADPVGLLHQDLADLAIVSNVDADEAGVRFLALFEFEIVALLPNEHALLAAAWLAPADFAAETLITYPVPDDMLDVLREVLLPAGVSPKRRTTELTVAILQLVASRRGIAALPLWAVKGYLDRGYVARQRIGETGLTGCLHAAVAEHLAARPDIAEFVEIMRTTSLLNLPDINLL